MHPVVVVSAIGLLAVIGYCDVRTRRIPNELSFAIAILGLARIALFDDSITAADSVLAGAVTFAAAILLFWRGVIGGGDAKLIAATVLLVGWPQSLRFLFLMSVCGGALALTTLLRQHYRAVRQYLCRRAGNALETEAANVGKGRADAMVPYGVAIAAAGVISLLLEGPLAR